MSRGLNRIMNRKQSYFLGSRVVGLLGTPKFGKPPISSTSRATWRYRVVAAVLAQDLDELALTCSPKGRSLQCMSQRPRCAVAHKGHIGITKGIVF